MDFKDHFERELAIANVVKDGPLYKDIMGLLDAVVAQGHESGAELKLMISMFYQLINGEVLNPLTGADDEWDQISPVLFQNKRCVTVFKELGVGCYNAHGIIFINEDDQQFVRQPQSRVAIKAFPYEPVSIYHKVKTKRSLILPHGVKSH